MGAPSSLDSKFSQSEGKFSSSGQKITTSGSGQPEIGVPNQYSNTVGMWDNNQQDVAQAAINAPLGKGSTPNKQALGKGA